MKIIKSSNGYCLATDQGVVCSDLPTFLTEQEAANWLIRITSELIELVTAMKFETKSRNAGKSGKTSILSISKPRRI